MLARFCEPCLAPQGQRFFCFFKAKHKSQTCANGVGAVSGCLHPFAQLFAVKSIKITGSECRYNRLTTYPSSCRRGVEGSSEENAAWGGEFPVPGGQIPARQTSAAVRQLSAASRKYSAVVRKLSAAFRKTSAADRQPTARVRLISAAFRAEAPTMGCGSFATILLYFYPGWRR